MHSLHCEFRLAVVVNAPFFYLQYSFRSLVRISHPVYTFYLVSDLRNLPTDGAKSIFDPHFPKKKEKKMRLRNNTQPYFLIICLNAHKIVRSRILPIHFLAIEKIGLLPMPIASLSWQNCDDFTGRQVDGLLKTFQKKLKRLHSPRIILAFWAI